MPKIWDSINLKSICFSAANSDIFKSLVFLPWSRECNCIIMQSVAKCYKEFLHATFLRTKNTAVPKDPGTAVIYARVCLRDVIFREYELLNLWQYYKVRKTIDYKRRVLSCENPGCNTIAAYRLPQ